jgi:cyclopropane fatty-acyl-phospholipid synthase-like methyltransferase
MILRKIAYKIVSLSHAVSVRFVHFLQKTLNVTHNYQPNPFDTRSKRKSRNSLDRYDAIFNNLPTPPKTLLDLGCNRGFFVLNAAANGIFSLGVDHDRFEIIYAKSSAEIYSVNNALFIHDEINKILIDGLPSFEMVVCASIFHHWVRIYGKESAFSMMQSIANKTDKYLVFETGQNNETQTRFYKYLEFMGESYEDWVEEFLLGLGFQEVKRIGMYSTKLSDVERTLFLAIK